MFWRPLRRLELHSEGFSGGVLRGSEAALEGPGKAFWSPGAALGSLWAACWPQVAVRMAPRGRHKAAKSWFLEPQSGPKRVQRASKRGIMQVML